MQELADKLNAIRENMRAEAVLCDMIRNGFQPEDIVVRFKGSHKKNWDSDIRNFEPTGKRLRINISRDGLFHSLPEFLFLQSPETDNLGKAAVNEFNRSQENKVSVLLNPVENELFALRTDLETVEDEQLGGLAMSDSIRIHGFWRLPARLYKRINPRLSALIPYVHAIVGDFEMTSRSLSFLLEDLVSWSFEQTGRSFHPDPYSTAAALGTYVTGDNLVTSGEVSEIKNTLVFTIGPIAGTDISLYIWPGIKAEAIKLFMDYFLPLEIDPEIKITVREEDQAFCLNESYLGFNTAHN